MIDQEGVVDKNCSKSQSTLLDVASAVVDMFGWDRLICVICNENIVDNV